MKTVETMMSNTNILATLKGKGLNLVLINSKFGDVVTDIDTDDIVLHAIVDSEEKEVRFEIKNCNLREFIDIKYIFERNIDPDIDHYEYLNNVEGSIELDKLDSKQDDDILDGTILSINTFEIDYQDIDKVIDMKYKNNLLCKLYKVISERLYYINHEDQIYINENF